MVTTYKDSGDKLTFTVAGADVTSGQMQLVGGIVGVHEIDALIGETAVFAVRGSFRNQTCLGTDVISVGDRLYWDDGNSRLTLTATANTFAGVASGDSPNGQTTVDVNLNVGSAPDGV